MLTKDAPKKLFLLDAYALIYRAYFAFAKNPRVNSKGQNTSAAFGFTNVLLDVMKTEKPTHLAVVFDPPGGSEHRQAEFEAYKAQREEMPEDIRSMILPIKTIVKAFNIPIIELAGHEADDVIAILAEWSQTNDLMNTSPFADGDPKPFMIVSGDHDFIQLQRFKNVKHPTHKGLKLIIKDDIILAEFENSEDVANYIGCSVSNVRHVLGGSQKTAKGYIIKYKNK